jgi:hypothetical protein
MGDLLAVGMATHLVLFVYFGLLIGLMLHELFLGQFDWLVFVGFPRKICLCLLHCFLENLKGLFIRIDKHFVVKKEGKFHIRDNSQI